jgi:hypothetical protein
MLQMLQPNKHILIVIVPASFQFKSYSTRPAHAETLAMLPTLTTLATAQDQASLQTILKLTQAFVAA